MLSCLQIQVYMNLLYFVNFHTILQQKFLKTLIGMFQLEPTQKLRQDHKLKKPSLEYTFLPPSPGKK